MKLEQELKSLGENNETEIENNSNNIENLQQTHFSSSTNRQIMSNLSSVTTLRCDSRKTSTPRTMSGSPTFGESISGQNDVPSKRDSLGDVPQHNVVFDNYDKKTFTKSSFFSRPLGGDSFFDDDDSSISSTLANLKSDMIRKQSPVVTCNKNTDGSNSCGKNGRFSFSGSKQASDSKTSHALTDDFNLTPETSSFKLPLPDISRSVLAGGRQANVKNTPKMDETSWNLDDLIEDDLNIDYPAGDTPALTDVEYNCNSAFSKITFIT